MLRVPPRASTKGLDSLPVKSPSIENISDGNGTPPAQAALDGRIADFEAQLAHLKGQVRQAQQLAHMGVAAPMIAHEVNNLLTPVLSYATYAAGCPDVALKDKALGIVMKNVKMLVAMTERVLHVSAASSTKPESCQIAPIVRDALDSMCRDLDKDGIRLKVDVDDAATAWCDPLQLQQVLFNLFLNARNAMAKQHDGRLTISARNEGDGVLLTIQDSGGGIPEELLPYIFDPLQSSKKAGENGRHRCSGLGLALCRDLVLENGGSLDVASDPGKGATFSIRLPQSERTPQ